jgi:predicted nucleotidyltransferase component of viral defense system
MQLYTNIISKNAHNLLESICSIQNLKSFYLVGGTALSLQIGHRLSEDLDFFSQEEFKSNIVYNIKKPYTVTSISDNSIEISIDKTKVFFFYFAFPLYKAIIKSNNIRIAHPIDIGLMKLLCLQGRTTKKDIVDLFFIHKKVMPLEKLLDIFEKHFPKASFNSYASLSSLIDPQILAKQKMPKMLRECNWDECLNLVEDKIKVHIKKLLN